MQAALVGRLPVVDDDRMLVGMLSINDVVLGAQNVRAGQQRARHTASSNGPNCLSAMWLPSSSASP